MKKRILSLSTVAFCAVSVFAQTPYDNFAPEQSAKSMIELPQTQFKVQNTDLNSEIRYIEFDKSTQSLILLNDDNSVLKTLVLHPNDKKFLTPDRFAEKYYHLSPYQYVANNPINNIDLNGDSIWFTYQYTTNAENQRVLSGVTMNVSGKVINVSSNSRVNMAEATNRISSQIASSFSGEINGVAFSTNVNLSVANSMDDVSYSDHVFALANMQSDGFGVGQQVQGAGSEFGGKVAFIDADYFTGPIDRTIGNVGPGTAAHEFGHLANLQHSNGLMSAGQGGIVRMTSTKVSSSHLTNIMNSYNMGYLNRGRNVEYIKVMSPAAGGYIQVPKPYRGLATPYVRY